MIHKILNRIPFFKKLLMLPILASLSGCVYLVVGGIGALGGYVVSPDTVEGIAKTESDTVWETALEVVSILGMVTESSRDAGIILVNVEKAHVRITIEALTDHQTRISVKARRYNFPRISTAQNVFVKIMSELTE
ncbi:MAG: hypothetical protein KC900_06440 [Candidatus Omnitrophica bacterium]|nr:hypothetical protein [Candidatus Omnitrophota bacterium]